MCWRASLTPKGIKSYKIFWHYYVLEHTHWMNRRLHVIGTALTFLFLLAAISQKNFLWLFGMPLVGYGFAWIGHFFVQKNRPATFTYPFWSLVADYQMFFLSLLGRMPAEIQSAVTFVRSQDRAREQNQIKHQVS